MSGDCRDACKNLIIIHNCVTTCLMRCINHIYIVAKYKTLLTRNSTINRLFSMWSGSRVACSNYAAVFLTKCWSTSELVTSNTDYLKLKLWFKIQWRAKNQGTRLFINNRVLKQFIHTGIFSKLHTPWLVVTRYFGSPVYFKTLTTSPQDHYFGLRTKVDYHT